MKIFLPLIAACLFISSASAQLASTEFTYQGSLQFNDAAANGTFDFEFSLWNSQTSGSQLGSQILPDFPVAGGVFTVNLDFGAVDFDGQSLWLEIAVREGSSAGLMSILAPRQKITASPYALFSDNIPDGSVDANKIDSTAVQRRVTGQCASGFMTTVNENGSVNCSSPGGTGSTLPSGMVSFFDLASCPSGWEPLIAAQGRALVGLNDGGQLAGVVGTPMVDLELQRHTHTVDPDPVNSGSGGTHSHTIDPPSTNTPNGGAHGHVYNSDAITTGPASQDHDHVWSTVNNDGSNIRWFSGGNGVGGSGPRMFTHVNGIGQEGLGTYPLGVDFEPPSGNTFYVTSRDGDNHTHSFDQGEQNVSSVNSTHNHSLDIGSFNSSGESSHVHSVDIPSTGTSLNEAATVMPYLQLLACRKT